MSDVRTLATRTVEANNAGDARALLDEIYAEHAVSVEAQAMPGASAEFSGLNAIRGKYDWWEGAHELHSSKAEGPFIHGENRFGVIYEIDVTNKESGERSQMRELGLYTIENGKIVREEFFY